MLFPEHTKPLIKGEKQMNHVRAITITGQEVEVTHEEAQRIAKSMHPHPTSLVDSFHKGVAERNAHYHHKACENIRAIAERHGFSDFHCTEDELKELLSCLRYTEDFGDLLVEVTEERIAHHHKEIYSE
jgi:hypothetical protein